MKVFYDSEHNACAVEFDKDDMLYVDTEDGKITITSSNGGKPEFIEKQLLFTLDGEIE